MVPLEYEEAEIVLEKMGGNWERWLAMPRRYHARLIATQRISRMVKVAEARDQAVRMEMKRAGRG